MEQNNTHNNLSMIRETPDRNGKRSGLGKTFALVLSAMLLAGSFSSCGTDELRQKAEDFLCPSVTEMAEIPAGGSEAEESTVAFAEESNAPSALALPAAAVSTARKLMTASEVYAASVNSTVGITTSINTNYFGYRTTAAASGSGFIVTPDGYIVTNYHVIEDSSSISVTLYDGTSYDAKLVGADESNDIAVLKVEATDLVPVTFGDSSKTLVGEDVIAIGNPLGELTFSLTKGVISALDREITLSTGVTMNLMQTDCAINSGNSGGALFNLYGEVIGITNAKYSGNGFSGEASIDNIGFAIPVNSVVEIIRSIMENGYVRKPYIGVSVGSVSEDLQKYGVPAGASVAVVEEGGAAEKAGIQVNDIITEANGEAVTSASDLSRIISAAGIGGTIRMKIYRQGEIIEVSVTTIEKPQTESADQEDEPSAQYNENPDSGLPYGGEGGQEDPGEYGNFFGFGNGDDFGSFFDWFSGSGDGIFDWFSGSGEPDGNPSDGYRSYRS